MAAETVWLAWDTNGVTGEGPWFIGVYRTEAGARTAAIEQCPYGRSYDRSTSTYVKKPGHDCGGSFPCEGVVWDVEEWDVDP